MTTDPKTEEATLLEELSKVSARLQSARDNFEKVTRETRKEVKECNDAILNAWRTYGETRRKQLSEAE